MGRTQPQAERLESEVLELSARHAHNLKEEHREREAREAAFHERYAAEVMELEAATEDCQRKLEAKGRRLRLLKAGFHGHDQVAGRRGSPSERQRAGGQCAEEGLSGAGASGEVRWSGP